MKKKFFSAALALLMVGGLASCNGGATKKSEPKKEQHDGHDHGDHGHDHGHDHGSHDGHNH